MRFARFLLLLVVAMPSPVLAWQTHLGPGWGSDEADAVVFDGTGNVIAGGLTQRSSDHGRATVAKLAPDGTLVWKKVLDPYGSRVDFVTADPYDDVVAAGMAGGTDESFFGYFVVSKLDGATGDVLWRYPALDSLSGRAVVDPAGDIVLSVRVPVYDEDGTIDRFRTRCVKLAGGDGSEAWRHDDCDVDPALLDHDGNVLGFAFSSAALVKLSDATGDELLRAPLAGGLYSASMSGLAALDPAGNIVIAGNDRAAKIAAADGAVLWQQVVTHFGGLLAGIRDIAVDGAGDVFAAGSTAFTLRRGTDFAVVKLSGQDGSERWHRIISGNDSRLFGTRAIATAIAIASDGRVIAAGAVPKGGSRNSAFVLELTNKHGHRIRHKQLEGPFGALNALAVGPFGVAVAGVLDPPSSPVGNAFATFVVAQVVGPAPLARDVRVYDDRAPGPGD